MINEMNFKKKELFFVLLKQCTSIGKGCATALYFKYIKLLLSSPGKIFQKNLLFENNSLNLGHHNRIESIKNQMIKENLIDQENKFISKWIFVIPSVIKNTNQIISSALLINENEQERIRLKLSIWTPM